MFVISYAVECVCACVRGGKVEVFHKYIDLMNGKCKHGGAAALCMARVDNCECTYACVCVNVSVSEHMRVGLRASLSIPVCI